MKRVTYHLTEQQLSKLEKIREETGRPVAESIRRILDEYFDKEAQIPPQTSQGVTK